MDNKFHGEPCPFGHTLRYVRGRRCAVCKNADSAREANVRKRVAYSQSNVEAARAASRKCQRRRNGVINPTSETGHGERCAICDVALTGKGNTNNAPVFDHDHTTGLFRGWLCSKHNRALGAFSDDPSLLRKAAAYVERLRQATAPVRLLEPEEPAGSDVSSRKRAGNPI